MNPTSPQERHSIAGCSALCRFDSLLYSTASHADRRIEHCRLFRLRSRCHGVRVVGGSETGEYNGLRQAGWSIVTQEDELCLIVRRCINVHSPRSTDGKNSTGANIVASFTMSSLHLPLSSIYLDDPKSQRVLRNRQSFLLVGSLIGTALAFTFLVAFASVHHSVGTEILAPQETSLLVRAEYPVSTYVYERGLFSWFIGIATTAAVGYAVSFTNVGTACVVAGPITVASCVGAAIAAVLVVATVAHVNSRQKKGNIELSLMRSAMIYMEPVDKSAKREIHPVEQFFSELYGVDDYRFEGRITADDHFNKPLVDRNKGYFAETDCGSPMHSRHPGSNYRSTPQPNRDGPVTTLGALQIL